MLFFILLCGACMALGAWVEEWRWLFVLGSVVQAGMVFLIFRQRGFFFKPWQLIWVAVALRLLVFFLPPTLSDDVYRYLWDGKVQRESGENVYEVLPSDLEKWHGDVRYERMNSPDYYTVYMPVSQWAFCWAEALGGGEFWRSYYVLKVMCAMSELAALLLLFWMLKGRWRFFLLYAWSPLVVMETWGQVHTEAFLLPFLALGIFFWRRGFVGRALGALTLGVWVKIYPLFFLPFIFRKWRDVRWLWVFVLLSGVVWWPFLVGHSFEEVLGMAQNVNSSLNLYVRQFEFFGGPYYFCKEVGNALFVGTHFLKEGEETSKYVGPLLRVVFLVSLPVFYLVAWRRKLDFSKACLCVLGWMYFLSASLHPWYFVPLLVFLVMQKKIGREWLWLSAWAPVTYLFYIWPQFYIPILWLAWGGFFFLLIKQWRQKK